MTCVNTKRRHWVLSATTTTLFLCSCGDNAPSQTDRQYTVGGSVTGLSGSIVLQNKLADNRTDSLTVTTTGTFTFPGKLLNGTGYNVSVFSQPPQQTCSVSDGAGKVSGSDVTNIAVVCVASDTRDGSIAVDASPAQTDSAMSPRMDAAVVLVAIHPASASVKSNGSQDFTAEVTGTTHTGVTWSVKESNGGSVDSSGRYTAPASTGTYHVEARSVADASKSATATVTVSGTPVLTVGTSSLPAGRVDSPYTASLVATGGKSPYHWSVSTGALPAGLTLTSSTGAISGTPTVAGNCSFAIQVTDADAATTTRNLSIVVTGYSGDYIKPDSVDGDVTVVIDSHTTSPISPYVFGVNGKYSMEQTGQQPWAPGTWSPRVSLSRIGGNTLSGIDWRTGYTNYTNDWCYWSTDAYADSSNAYGGPTVPGSSFKRWAEPSFKDNTAFLWTLPLLPYVARDANHPEACSDTSVPRSQMSLDWNNPNREMATSRYQLDFLPADRTRVWKWIGKNPSGATATPSMTGDGYADDFVKWLTVNYPGQSKATDKRIMVALDNEPDNWCWDSGAKHGWALGWSSNMPNAGSYTVELGHDYFVNRTVEMASAVKDVDQNIDVFGGVFMGYWGLYSLGNMAQPGAHAGHGVDGKFMKWPSGKPQTGVTFPFLEMWLEKLDTLSGSRGNRLVDVLDTHYYHDAFTRDGRNSAGNDTDSDESILHSRMQAPRAFWDASYHSNSEIEWKDGQWGLNGTTTSIRAGGVATHWISRLKEALKKYPNGPQKLAFTEYQLGRPGDISGAIAQADILGVFAREGVYAATMWPMTTQDSPGYGSMAKAFAGYGAAFKAWVDYDGNGSGHGDMYVQTTVQDSHRPADPNRPDNSTQTLERITAYATVDAADPNRIVIIAMNKTLGSALNVGFQLTHTKSFKVAQIYRVTGGNGTSAAITGPTKQSNVSITGTNVFNATLPAQSITVMTLAP